jgi:hypothetical protein
VAKKPDPHNEFDKQFAELSPKQLKEVVYAASSHVQKLDTSGKSALTSHDVKQMKIADMGLSALNDVGSNRGLDQPVASPSNPTGGRGFLKFGLGQIGEAGIVGAATFAVGSAAGIGLGAVLAGRQIWKALGPGGGAAPMSGQRSPHVNPSLGYLSSSAHKGSDVIGAPSASPRATSFAAESDQARHGATSTAAAFGHHAGVPIQPRLKNVFESKFAEAELGADEHRHNLRNHRMVRQQIENAARLADIGIEARPENVTDVAKAKLLDGGTEGLKRIQRTGRVGLAQSGFMGEEETRFAVRPPEGATKPAPAPAFG